MGNEPNMKSHSEWARVLLRDSYGNEKLAEPPGLIFGCRFPRFGGAMGGTANWHFPRLPILVLDAPRPDIPFRFGDQDGHRPLIMERNDCGTAVSSPETHRSVNR